LIIFWFSLPSPLFKTPTSTVLEDSKGDLLSVRIADDGQWRFPTTDSIPSKFEAAITTFEDKYFRYHPGIDPLAIMDALYQNIKTGRIVRGGSTLTMQVIRLSRKNKSRTLKEKLVEAILAVRLELSYSKDEILKLYLREAPFGGNIVGLEAASWRYFGRSPEKLSWAETATLAVLPNSPSLIFPGNNQDKLLIKRNKLLKKLFEIKLIDKTSYGLALHEPLPEKLLPLPSFAPHLLVKTEKDGNKGMRNKTSIDVQIQKRVDYILKKHQARLAANGVFNAAVLVLDVNEGTVISYNGNVESENQSQHGYNVDLIQAKRSTGSILKPFLFAMMLQDGKLLSNSLVADIPTLIDGYAPKNYYLTYDGAVAFKNAISRSLNVPAVRILQQYGIQKFHTNMKKLGMTSLNKPANHYGLSIILGGAEGTLWDLANIYRNMAFNLNYYHRNYSKTPSDPYKKATYLTAEPSPKLKDQQAYPLNPASIWATFEAMNEVSRPEEESNWTDFSSSYKIAWKTGTSFGNRDAWAIGCTSKYIVAVWVGNADGEGRPELTGIGSAAPIMFEAFKLLKPGQWFMQPFNDMAKTEVCLKSGFKANADCVEKEEQWIFKKGLNGPSCPYHKKIFLDKSERYRVGSNCISVNEMLSKSWFVLPPAMEYFYKAKNASYQTLPPFKPGCETAEKHLQAFEIIYPSRNSKIYIPIEINGKPGRTVFEVAHRQNESTLFWYLDNEFVGTTKGFHQIALNPETGDHRLTVTDERGESKAVNFEVTSKN
jgi:penicillin-binding protein 1C